MRENKVTTKEKIIRESISRISKRIERLETIMNSNPASDLIDVRKEAQKLLEENKSVESRISPDFLKKLERLSKREKECWNMIGKQREGERNSDELVSLNMELSDLNTELYFIENSRR